MARYFILYKPYGILSQFSREVPKHRTLADLYDFPKDVYPVGRLDKDSEGLLILTDDKELNQRLLHPDHRHERTYLVQVERVPTAQAIEQLQSGVDIRINKKIYHTGPARAVLLDTTPAIPDRHPPVRFRKNVPTAWIELKLTEGKNRQVRRMCAAVGFPVLRLIRTKIEDLELRSMQPGEVTEMKKEPIYRFLKV